jgi:hypothetical protein
LADKKSMRGQKFCRRLGVAAHPAGAMSPQLPTQRCAGRVKYAEAKTCLGWFSVREQRAMSQVYRSRRERLAALSGQLRAEGMTWSHIGALIRGQERVNARVAMRMAHGWTQAHTARLWNEQWLPGKGSAGITDKHISYWETWPESGHEPSIKTLKRLAQLYQCDVGHLLDDGNYSHLDEARMLADAKADVISPHESGTPSSASADIAPAETLELHHDGVTSSLASLAFIVGGQRRPGEEAERWVGPLRRRRIGERPPNPPESPAALGTAALPERSAPGGSLPARGVTALALSCGGTLARAQAAFTDGPGYQGGIAEVLEPQSAGAAADIGVSPSAADDLMIRGALDGLTSYERQFGGGHALSYAMDYWRLMVQPRVHLAADGRAFRDLCALAVEFSLRVASIQLDIGNAKASRELLNAGLPLAQETGSPTMVAWVLARFGELDMRESNVERALAYTGGAAAMVARSAPRARAFILAKHALALSLTGDRPQTLRLLGRAQDSFGKAAGNGEPGWMRFYGIEHLQHDRARCLNNLGMGDDAVKAAEESMLARRLSRPRAFSLAVQAVGHLQGSDKAVDRACEIGSELVAVTSGLASDRVQVELAKVLAALHPYRKSAAVRDLCETARPVLGD